MLFAATETIDSGTCGTNLTWTLDSEGTLTISGTGEMTDYSVTSSDTAPWYEDKYNIQTIVIESGVTSIGRWAFSGCNALTSVTLPESLITIGDSAFVACTSLTSVSIPNSVTDVGVEAFLCCTALTEVVLPDSVTVIQNNAFNGCSAPEALRQSST